MVADSKVLGEEIRDWCLLGGEVSNDRRMAFWSYRLCFFGRRIIGHETVHREDLADRGTHLNYDGVALVWRICVNQVVRVG